MDNNRRYLVYAVDFDGTICSNAYPEIGKPNEKLISYLKIAKHSGDKLVLWTCRAGERLTEAIDWCEEHGLEFDAVNDNIPEIMESYGDNTRKIFADVYIDDKAKNIPIWNVPFTGGASHGNNQ